MVRAWVREPFEAVWWAPVELTSTMCVRLRGMAPISTSPRFPCRCLEINSGAFGNFPRGRLHRYVLPMAFTEINQLQNFGTGVVLTANEKLWRLDAASPSGISNIPGTADFFVAGAFSS